ncbi:DUF4223 family protein [Salmonella enterica subsp. enterica]|nr:DUF4223 family protein [Salmonella enterica subsp. enterica]
MAGVLATHCLYWSYRKQKNNCSFDYLLHPAISISKNYCWQICGPGCRSIIETTFCEYKKPGFSGFLESENGTAQMPCPTYARL